MNDIVFGDVVFVALVSLGVSALVTVFLVHFFWKGLQGPPGERGPEGPPGPAGAMGAPGRDGAVIPAPSAGASGVRRAVFVYEAARLHAAATGSRVVPEPWPERDDAFRAQFADVVGMMCGPDRKSDPAELHQDWVETYQAMGWRHGPVRDVGSKTHPDMVPFDDLPLREQEKDAVFVALCEIARLYLHDNGTA